MILIPEEAEMGEKRSGAFTNLERGQKFNELFMADRDIFLEGIEAKSTPSILRIHVTIDKPSRLFVTRRRGSETITENLNSGQPLLPNCAYIFDVMTRQDHNVNFHIDSTAKVLYMQVVEIPIPGESPR